MADRDAARIELWLCQDCMLLEETGDATFLDYHLTEREASARLKEIEAGWASLRKQGEVYNDCTEDLQVECTECHHIARKSDCETRYHDEFDEHQLVCPRCGSVDEMRDREHGEDEFSHYECDSCGTSLGGSRHRYALFPRQPAEGGSLVPGEVAQSAG